MNKKKRFDAVRKLQQPDYMPVWPRAGSQLIYGMGWRLTDITGNEWYDSDKCTEAVLWSLKHINYDVAIPAYMDSAFGVPSIGGNISIPSKFGTCVEITNDKPVKSKADWCQIQKNLARLSITNADCRMKGALTTIRHVADDVGKSTPLVTTGYLAATAAMLLFRPLDDFLEDMIIDPEWVDQMCRVSADWTLDWIRSQYDAGANSVTFIADSLGTHLISPQMGERFNLPYLCELVEVIKKEFNQSVWLHVHGNMNTPLGLAYLEKIIHEAGVEGLHLDDCHTPEWIKKNVVDTFNIPACIATDCHKIAQGPVERIQSDVKVAMAKVNDGLGLIMAPCCQVLPYTPNEHFKAWVDATHEYGQYPLSD